MAPSPPGGFPSRETHGENTDDMEDSGLTRTCHLCGKAQCGQRKGRVRCAYCKRIFCLQQLYKKFKIKASTEDMDFKCPRCLGICCCVCNCQKPPPHVHCKVYKVRQTKRKTVPNVDPRPSFPSTIPFRPETMPRIDPGSVNPTNLSPPIDYHQVQPAPLPSIPSPIPEQQAPAYSYYSTEIPGSKNVIVVFILVQHSDWLTQLNLQMLDNPEAGDSTLPSFFSTDANNSGDLGIKLAVESIVVVEGGQKFADSLRNYITHRLEMNSVNRHTIIS